VDFDETLILSEINEYEENLDRGIVSTSMSPTVRIKRKVPGRPKSSQNNLSHFLIADKDN